MTDSRLQPDPNERSLEGADLGEDREVIPGIDADDPSPTPGSPETENVGGPDTQLAPNKD